MSNYGILKLVCFVLYINIKREIEINYFYFCIHDTFYSCFNCLGKCLGQFSNRKIPYCVKFNPDEDKQNLFVAGTSDKKIVCVSFFGCYCLLYRKSNN